MHSSALPIAAAASALLSVANAHGWVTGARVNLGTWTDGQNPNWYYTPTTTPPTAGWKALNQDNGFVEPAAFQTTDINCHKSALTNTKSVAAKAGDTLTVYWNTWPDTHHGPVINYLAPVSSFASATAGALSWTKIQQAGLISGSSPGTWATDQLIATGNFSSTVKIPAKLKAGNYVLRHEIIALHSAGSDNGAQAYPQCLNVVVSGSGSVAIPAGTPGASLYKRTDPGILFNLYTSFSSYTIPGPAVWTGAN